MQTGTSKTSTTNDQIFRENMCGGGDEKHQRYHSGDFFLWHAVMQSGPVLLTPHWKQHYLVNTKFEEWLILAGNVFHVYLAL